jgi:O-antigen ligase
MLAGTAWASSPYLRARVLAVSEEIDRYESKRDADVNSSGFRLTWWKQSIEFIAAAPILGHGTGATRQLFREAAVKDPSLLPALTDNPHNHTLSIAIQLGLVGVGLLYAMWIAHFLLFRGIGMPAWIGAGIVVQNVVGSLFNSQIFYFTPGWIYVIGVGVLGGVMLRSGAGVAPPPERR